ncbi:transposase [Granulicella sp. 5B5]|nr:transposase [Granulicella sp. 5B5]
MRPSSRLISKRPVAAKRGDKALGRSRGGLTTKIHLLVNGEGQPLQFRLSAGQRSDYTEALALLGVRRLISDRGYDSRASSSIPRLCAQRSSSHRRSTATSNESTIQTCTNSETASQEWSTARRRGRGQRKGFFCTHRLRLFDS